MAAVPRIGGPSVRLDSLTEEDASVKAGEQMARRLKTIDADAATSEEGCGHPVLRNCIWALAIPLLFLSQFGATSAAQIRAIRVHVNNETIVFDPPPVIVHGRVLAPYKQLLPYLDAFGGMDRGDRLHAFAGRLGGRPAVTLFLNSRQEWLLLDQGECRAAKLDTGPRFVDGELMVPLRALAEGVGVRVHWDVSSRTVFLSFAPGQPRSAVNPPKPIRPVHVHGEWKVEPSNIALVCATCSEDPLTSAFRAPTEVRYGAPIEMEVGFYKLGRGTITLRQPVTLRVEVRRQGQCGTVWEGILPPLRGSVPSGFARFRLLWDQRDGSGRPVEEASGYSAAVVLPATIAYEASDGTPRVEKLDKRARGALIHVR